jgi:hypothetical protein
MISAIDENAALSKNYQDDHNLDQRVGVASLETGCLSRGLNDEQQLMEPVLMWGCGCSVPSKEKISMGTP